MISAHEARRKASRTQDADRAYAAVSAALRHAYSRISAASENGANRTMFTVMPEFHGFNSLHATQAAREVAEALRRKGYSVTTMSPTDILISWAEGTASKRPPSERVAPDDEWRFQLTTYNPNNSYNPRSGRPR